MIDLGETTMTTEEVDAYLSADGRFAAVTLREDGSPFVISLGYYYDGSYLYLSTTPNRLTHRLRRDGRASVAIFDHEAIHGYVLVNGLVEQIDDPGNVLNLKMHHRYPKPGLEDSEEHDRICSRRRGSCSGCRRPRLLAWTSATRVVRSGRWPYRTRRLQRKTRAAGLTSFNPASCSRARVTFVRGMSCCVVAASRHRRPGESTRDSSSDLVRDPQYCLAMGAQHGVDREV